MCVHVRVVPQKLLGELNCNGKLIQAGARDNQQRFIAAQRTEDRLPADRLLPVHRSKQHNQGVQVTAIRAAVIVRPVLSLATINDAPAPLPSESYHSNPLVGS
jgi:hypothetical protein